MKPRLLDLFCCQGGASVGYARAGFDVYGVDIERQPKYPFEMLVADAVVALKFWIDTNGIREFDAIHASPPCQAFTRAQQLQGNEHPELIEPIRTLLKRIDKPYVIENVVGAPLHDPVMLCGAMFPELRVYRHRLFESNVPLEVPQHPEHVVRQAKMGRKPAPGEFIQCVGNFTDAAYGREAMDMPWASRDGVREAIPPAYTEFIGRQLMEAIR